MGMTGTSPGTVTVNIPGVGAVMFSDWIDTWHWTTIQLENGLGQSLDAFTQGRSQPITGGQRNSTLVDTNIPSPGGTGLPKAWQFIVYGFGAEFTRAARAAAANLTLGDFSDPLRQRTYFELNRRIHAQYFYNGKDYTEGLLEDFPSGHGPAIFTTQASTEQVNNGLPSPRDRVAMVLPLHETELLGYRMTITPVIPLAIAQPASDAGANLTFVDLRLLKTGLVCRPVR